MSGQIQTTLLVTLMLLFTGCGSLVHHQVQKGDTLYSISWRYGQDVRELAAWNKIDAPYVIHQGQMLRIAPPLNQSNPALLQPRSKQQSRAVPVIQSKSSSVTQSKPQPQRQTSTPGKAKYEPLTWSWPATGKLLRTFSAKKIDGNGVDISGPAGSPVRAAANGRVVYSGNGLTHYGNLLIIKHNESYLSAYAHNDKLLVKEGESVNKGQKVAAMGATGSDRVMLHFEIRFNGKPVDPLRYLPKR